MSKFSDLMKQTLPSKQNVMLESADSDNKDDILDSLNDIDENPVLTGDDGTEGKEKIDTADTKPAKLNEEESRKADDIMNAVATPLLIQQEMAEDNMTEFLESFDADIMEKEGYLTERSIVKLDKHAKRAQLHEVAVIACARANNDPLLRKYNYACKLKRVILAKLRKKYDAQARIKTREYLNKARKSKSNTLSKAANKLLHNKK